MTNDQLQAEVKALRAEVAEIRASVEQIEAASLAVLVNLASDDAARWLSPEGRAQAARIAYAERGEAS